jgi:hypothetical protein
MDGVMRRCFLALSAVLLTLGIGVVARAQIAAPILFGHAPAASYTGPGDAVSGAFVWYGLRGYDAAYATGSNYAICVGATSGNACPGAGHSYGNVKILANGNLDVATTLSAIGVSGTGSCTISGTTMTCATGTGTLQMLGSLVGTGVIGYQTSANCSSFPCTVSVWPSQTVVSAVSVTSYNSTNIGQWFDQSGANACSGAPCNTPKSSGDNEYLVANCVNSQPCAVSVGVNAFGAVTLTSSVSAPVTLSAVGERLGSFTTYGVLMSLALSPNQMQWYWENSANKVSNGGSFDATAADSTPHAMQFVTQASGSNNAVVNVDGTETTGTANSSVAATTVYFLSNLAGTAPPNALIMEEGVWPSALSQANRTLLCGNEAAYWGITPGTYC